MANVIPKQLTRDGRIIHDVDRTLTRKEIEAVLKNVLGEKVSFFDAYPLQRIVTAEVTIDAKKSYLIMANITFMGGTEGQHPTDLKRIQYNFHWSEFYDQYSSKGEVHWMGIYSYDDNYIFADFEPTTYLRKRESKGTIAKGGGKAMYSCHIYLNDLYEGIIDSHFEKIDHRGNIIHTIAPSFLSDYLSGIKMENPIISKIKDINRSMIPWNRWILAKEAIPYMRSLVTAHEDAPAFDQWRQTRWGGWLLEAYYSEYLYAHPNAQICYLATVADPKLWVEYNNGLDLAFPAQKFVGDLKAATINGDGLTLLNDEAKVNAALEKYKRIWFLFYLYDSKPGDYNDYEMVIWRNNYRSIIDRKIIEDPHDSANTNHSICYQQMVVIELNEITKDKYFTVGKQFGLNSDGKERNQKYKVAKRFLKSFVEDDSFIIYRENHTL